MGQVILNIASFGGDCVVPNVWTLYTPARKLHSLVTI
jgi:hypothetical protein